MISPPSLPPPSSASQNFNSLPYFHYMYISCINMFEISIRTDTRPGRRVGCLSLRVTECECVWFPQPNNTYATNSIRARTKKIKFPLQQYCENNGFFVYDGRKSVRCTRMLWFHTHLSSSSSLPPLSVEWWMIYTEWNEMKLKNCEEKTIRWLDDYIVLMLMLLRLLSYFPLIWFY